MCNFKEVKFHVNEIDVIIVNIAYANRKICEKQRGNRFCFLKVLYMCDCKVAMLSFDEIVLSL